MKTLEKPGFSEEAPAGFEPAMSDLQSDALATWPRRPDHRQPTTSYSASRFALLSDKNLSVSTSSLNLSNQPLSVKCSHFADWGFEVLQAVSAT